MLLQWLGWVVFFCTGCTLLVYSFLIWHYLSKNFVDFWLTWSHPDNSLGRFQNHAEDTHVIAKHVVPESQAVFLWRVQCWWNKSSCFSLRSFWRFHEDEIPWDQKMENRITCQGQWMDKAYLMTSNKIGGVIWPCLLTPVVWSTSGPVSPLMVGISLRVCVRIADPQRILPPG